MRFKEVKKKEEVNAFEYKEYKDLQEMIKLSKLGKKKYKVWDSDDKK